MMFPFNWNSEPRTVLDITYDFFVVKLVTKSVSWIRNQSSQ